MRRQTKASKRHARKLTTSRARRLGVGSQASNRNHARHAPPHPEDVNTRWWETTPPPEVRHPAIGWWVEPEEWKLDQEIPYTRPICGVVVWNNSSCTSVGPEPVKMVSANRVSNYQVVRDRHTKEPRVKLSYGDMRQHGIIRDKS